MHSASTEIWVLDCNIKDDTFKLVLNDDRHTQNCHVYSFLDKPLNLIHDSLRRNKNNNTNTNTNTKNVWFFVFLAGLEPDGCQALRMLEHEADTLSLS